MNKITKFLHKNANKIYWIVILQFLGIEIFIMGHRYATEWRGYQAIGGEAAFFLLPFIVYLIKKVIVDEVVADVKQSLQVIKEDIAKRKNSPNL